MARLVSLGAITWVNNNPVAYDVSQAIVLQGHRADGAAAQGPTALTTEISLPTNRRLMIYKIGPALARQSSSAWVDEHWSMDASVPTTKRAMSSPEAASHRFYIGPEQAGQESMGRCGGMIVTTEAGIKWDRNGIGTRARLIVSSFARYRLTPDAPRWTRSSRIWR